MGRIDGLGACGCGTCESFEIPVMDCPRSLSLDMDTPSRKGFEPLKTQGSGYCLRWRIVFCPESATTKS